VTSTAFFRPYHRLMLFATLPMWLAFQATANAAEPDEPGPDTEPDSQAEKRPVPGKAEATAAASGTPGPANAAEASAPILEHMGPETFPGRLRGIYGGSLWLEPDFQGLQWPQNTRTGLGISADFWVDSGKAAILRGSEQRPNSDLLFQQGRALLRLTPAYVQGSFFAQAQVELVGNICQSTIDICRRSNFPTDDLFIRFGTWNSWDLKVGRFRAWEVYHTGMGMDPYTIERLGAGMFGVDPLTTPQIEAPLVYGVTYMWERPTEGMVGDAALHLYPTEYLRFELLGKLGTDNNRADNATGETAWNYAGGRPTLIFDVGWFKLRLAGEYQQRTATTQTLDPGGGGQKKDPVPKRVQKGAGGSFQFVFNPIVEFGVNAAIGKQEDVDGFGRPLPENSFTTTSVGGFANVRLAERWVGGVGVNWTAQTDTYLATGSSLNNFTAQLQSFAALQYRPVGQFYIKAVFSYARSDFLPSDLAVAEWHNQMFSGRIRLLYIY
jgi:hypothetical protein